MPIARHKSAVECTTPKYNAQIMRIGGKLFKKSLVLVKTYLEDRLEILEVFVLNRSFCSSKTVFVVLKKKGEFFQEGFAFNRSFGPDGQVWT